MISMSYYLCHIVNKKVCSWKVQIEICTADPLTHRITGKATAQYLEWDLPRHRLEGEMKVTNGER